MFKLVHMREWSEQVAEQTGSGGSLKAPVV